jgi:hypothetical protein
VEAEKEVMIDVYYIIAKHRGQTRGLGNLQFCFRREDT